MVAEREPAAEAAAAAAAAAAAVRPDALLMMVWREATGGGANKRKPSRQAADLLTVARAHALGAADVLAFFCDAVLDESGSKGIKAHAPLLRELAAADADQRALLVSLERAVAFGRHAATLGKKAAALFKALYDNDVVGEGVIIAWHATPPPPGLAALRLAVAPLVTWLQEAEEESD